MTHAGAGQNVTLRPRPVEPPAVPPRVGGSDAVNAATWRVTPLPTGHRPAGDETSREAGVGREPSVGASRDEDSVAFEAFDRPGMLLTLSSLLTPGAASDEMGPSGHSLQLEAASSAAASKRRLHQRWVLRSFTSSCPPPSSSSDTVALESAALPGVWLRGDVQGRQLTAGPGRAQAALFQLTPPLARYPPLALWASSNVTCAGRDAANCREQYLMVPLRDIIDETYAAHLCVLPSNGRRAPDFCHQDPRPFTH